MADARASRPADDAAARRPRDDRDRPRLGLRPAASLDRTRSSASRPRSTRASSGYLDAVIERVAAGPAGGPVHRPQAAPAARARRLRAARRDRGAGGDLPRPHPPRRLPGPVRVPARAVPRRGRPRPTRGSRSAAAPGAASAPPSPQIEMRIAIETILRSVELRPASPELERPVRRNVTLSPARTGRGWSRLERPRARQSSSRVEPRDQLGDVDEVGVRVEHRVEVELRRRARRAGRGTACPCPRRVWAASWTSR